MLGLGHPVPRLYPLQNFLGAHGWVGGHSWKNTSHWNDHIRFQMYIGATYNVSTVCGLLSTRTLSNKLNHLSWQVSIRDIQVLISQHHTQLKFFNKLQFFKHGP